jgi:UPF0755 protein
METEDYHKYIQKRGKWMKKLFFIFLTMVIIFPLVAVFSYPFISGPAESFSVGEVFEIEKGMGVSDIADFLEDEGYIKSATIFKLYDRWDSNKTKNYSGIKAGKYIFKNQLDVFGVYRRLKVGESGIENIKVTILEGEANYSIANKISGLGKFKNFDAKKFIDLAKNEEGYLYPDTYEFSPYVTERGVIDKMKENFENKAGYLIKKINQSNRSLDKILKMASIIELEAGISSIEIKKKVSGILWRRIEIGMMLQVDVSFNYIEKRHLYTKEIGPEQFNNESLYNSYKHKGLPPTAIGNPSVASIEAAMYPTATKDIFYLTGKDGKFHYAKSNAEHEKNKNKYIKNYVPEVVEEKVDQVAEEVIEETILTQ